MSGILDFQMDELEARLAFAHRLQALSNKIHATDYLDEVLLDMARDICDLFQSERVTLYAVGEHGKTIRSMVKTGIRSNQEIILPISHHSIAGYVARSRRGVSITNVRDQAELARFDPELRFCDKVDQLTGYSTQQMLAAPIHSAGGKFLGVIQLINTRHGGPFSGLMREGLDDLCAVLAVAYAKRLKAPAPTAPPPPDPLLSRRDFARQLQSLTNRIHAAHDLDAIMLDLAPQVCALFNCDRLSLYAVSKDGKQIYSKIKTGIRSSKDLTLPVGRQSIAGNVALTKLGVRLNNVYDEEELRQHERGLVFCRRVDELTGYTSRQMLALPILEDGSEALLGVIQLINNREGGEFGTLAMEGLHDLCEALAVSFSRRLHQPKVPPAKYAALIVEGLMSEAEFELAIGWARRHKLDLEDALVNEFQLERAALGRALSRHFGVPYEPLREDRSIPPDLWRGQAGSYFEERQWLPLEKDKVGLVVLCLDPARPGLVDQVRALFPYGTLLFRVTTRHEFKMTLELSSERGGE